MFKTCKFIYAKHIYINLKYSVVLHKEYIKYIQEVLEKVDLVFPQLCLNSSVAISVLQKPICAFTDMLQFLEVIQASKPRRRRPSKIKALLSCHGAATSITFKPFFQASPCTYMAVRITAWKDEWRGVLETWSQIIFFNGEIAFAAIPQLLSERPLWFLIFLGDWKWNRGIFSERLHSTEKKYH